MSAQIRTSRP